MDWTTILILAAVVAAFLLFKRVGQISAKAAREYIKHGALVIDVRTAAEYGGGHLQRAVNMPLPEIEPLITRKVKDKDQVLLLHCQSGVRSGLAKKKLIALGYPNTFNIGSYGRALRVVDGA
jgi:phage shock protein E